MRYALEPTLRVTNLNNTLFDLFSPHQICPWELSCLAMPRPLALFYTSYRDAKHMIQSILRTTVVFAVKAPGHRRLRRDQRRLAESRAGVPATSACQTHGTRPDLLLTAGRDVVGIIYHTCSHDGLGDCCIVHCARLGRSAQSSSTFSLTH